MRMIDGVGTLNGSAHSRDCRVGVAEQPERPRHQGQVGHPSILASRAGRQSFLLAACVERLNGPFDRFESTGETSHEKANHSLSAHRVEQLWSSTARFGEMKQGRVCFFSETETT